MIGVLAFALAADPERPPGPARCTAPRARPCHIHDAAEVAADRLTHATETRSREAFLEVAELYARLVTVSPDPEYDWYRAYALFSAGEWADAERAYAPFAQDEASRYRDIARYQILGAREGIVLQRHGSLEALPADATVEAVVTTAAGRSITRYALAAEHVALIASADDLANNAVSDAELAPFIEQNRAYLLFVSAEILNNHGHHAEARLRFEQIIEEFPKRGEAAYAGAAIVRAFQKEGDLDEVNRRVIGYQSLGPEPHPCCLDPVPPEQVEFNRAYKLAQDGDRPGAVVAYRAYLEAYPASRYRKEVLANLANSLDILGRAAEARQTWLQFRTEHPEEERVPGFLFRIADSYTETQDLDEAIATYLELQRTYPEYPDAPSAVYNAALLLSCLGRHADAARAFTTYADTYRTESDAEAVAWRATQEWASVSSDDGLAAYQRYLTRYPKEDGDHLVEGWYQLARLYETRGDTRRASDAWEHLQRAFDAAGHPTARARSLAATQPLVALEARVAAFGLGTHDDASSITRLSKDLPDELRAITAESQRIMERYQDPDTVAEALYREGVAYVAFADRVHEQTLESDDFDAAEARGRNRLLTALDGAAEAKRWSDWNTRALVLLHERYPGEFPAQRVETWGRPPTWEYAGAVAMSVSGSTVQRPYEF